VQYEATIIVKGANIQDATPGREAVDSIFQKCNVNVADRQEWGHRKFWHPVEKTADGVFLHYVIDAQPQDIAPLNRECRLNGQILRTFIVKKKAKAAK
jgi:ribosomal protein S6